VDFEWIERPERWRELRDVWDGVVARSAEPSIYATFDFLESSFNHFALPHRSELAILVLWEGGRLEGFAPLRLSQTRFYGVTVRKLSLLNDWEADRAPLVFPAGKQEECALAMFSFLSQQSWRWDFLKIRQVSPAGDVARGVSRWCHDHKNLVLLERDRSPSPFVPLAGLSWELYLAGLGARTRKNVRRLLHHVDGEGGHLEVFEEPGRMGLALDLYLDLEIRSWKRQAGQGVGKNSRNAAFYRDLLPRLAADKRASVSFLKVGHRRVAALIEYRFEDSVYAIQTVFDDQAAISSPGAALQALCLKRWIGAGARDYELCANFLEDKLRWTSHLRENREVVIQQRSRPRHWFLFGPGAIRRRLRGLLRSEDGPGRRDRAAAPPD
jgi:CelD/BcsL family acetyltransferase involved in cellulose biosynthesis